MALAEARPAATVIVVREGRSAPEILLLKRSRRVGFFPDAWVFPGGRVDAADADVPLTGRCRGLPEGDHAFGVAAIRECFEETGVWLGEGTPPTGLREQLIGRQRLLGSDLGLVADLDRLSLWSWWVTPDTEPRRYDTRFFLSVLPVGLRPVAEADGQETVASRWMAAADALVEAARGALFMAPPTFRTLEQLARYDSLAALRDAGSRRTVRPIQPVMRRDLPDSDGYAVLLPGDPEHPDPDPVPGGTRIVLRGGRWVSEVSPRG